ncbi:MAG: hypothetical protein IJP98_05220 [Clostridia bacterium]|nr:hypothetical protein [Clostridia bacterium]
MKFQDEYRKANNAISAPKALLDTIREQAAAQQEPEVAFAASFARPKRILPRVLGYSGAAVAVAALVLLIVRPFGLNFGNKAAAQAPMVAESLTAGYETASLEMVAEESIASENESKMLFGVNAIAADGYDGDGDGMMDDYVPYTIPDPTYEDIFASLYATGEPEAPAAEAVKSAAAEDVPAVDEMLFYADGVLSFGEYSVTLPAERTLCTAFLSDEHVFVLAEADGRTFVTVYDSALNECGEAAADGAYFEYEVRETTLLSESGTFESYQAVILTTEWTVNLDAAAEDTPETFCPSISDASGTRILTPDEISIVSASDRYTVFLAVAWDDGVRILYGFAELGL